MSEDSREIWFRLTPLATAIFFFFFFFDKKSEERSSKGRSVLVSAIFCSVFVCFVLNCSVLVSLILFYSVQRLFCFIVFRFGEPRIVDTYTLVNFILNN